MSHWAVVFWRGEYLKGLPQTWHGFPRNWGPVSAWRDDTDLGPSPFWPWFPWNHGLHTHDTGSISYILIEWATNIEKLTLQNEPQIRTYGSDNSVVYLLPTVVLIDLGEIVPWIAALGMQAARGPGKIVSWSFMNFGLAAWPWNQTWKSTMFNGNFMFETWNSNNYINPSMVKSSVKM